VPGQTQFTGPIEVGAIAIIVLIGPYFEVIFQEVVNILDSP
jgi:hypothetical protein